jgi:hypothetical protein
LPSISREVDFGSLATRQTPATPPKANITFFSGKDCQPGDGPWPKTDASDVVPGTCKAAQPTGYHYFTSAIAEANVPAGFNCTLQLYRSNGATFRCADISNYLIGTAQVGECLSAVDTFRANFVLWSCAPPPPPSGYPLADVTLCAAPGCLLSNTEAACHKYNWVEPNVCMKADKNLLPLVLSGRADVVGDPPITISPGYKCELVLYATDFCYSRIGASNPSKPGVCISPTFITVGARSFKWQCGL